MIRTLVGWEGHEEALRALVTARADLNLKDENGWTPLMLAAARGELGAVDVLAPFSDLSAVDGGGRTAMEIAAIEGHVDVVGALKAASIPGGEDAMAAAIEKDRAQGSESSSFI